MISPVSSEPESHQLYKRRFLILGIFCTFCFCSSGQWTSYASITNIVQYYYNTSSMAVNIFSMLYLISYVVFVFPVMWLYESYGLKKYVVTASFLNTLGAWIKFGGSSSSGFLWIVLGQAISAVSNTFIHSIPAGISAVWFGENERTIATSLSLFACQLGVAVYFVIVPIIIVPRSESYDELFQGFSWFNGGNAVFCTLITIAILIAFEDAPPTPPSRSQALHTHGENNLTLVESLKRLIRNSSYILLLVTFGIYIGTFYAYATLLNEMLLRKGRVTDIEIGILGFAFVIAGLPGGVVVCIYVSKTNSYHCVAKLLIFMTILAIISFAVTVEFSGNIVVLYISIIFLGFVGISFLPLGLEYAAELTYPVQEGASSSLLNASAQVFGILFIIAGGIFITQLHTWYNILLVNLFLGVVMILGFISILFVKPHLVRQEVDSGKDNVHTQSLYQTVAENSENED